MPTDAAPLGFIKVKDGALNISAGNDPMFERVCRNIGGSILNDPKYKDIQTRIDNNDVLLKAIEDHINSAGLSADEAEELFAQWEIPAGKVKTWKDVFEDEQVKFLKHFVPVEVPNYGELLLGRFPGRFSNIEYCQKEKVPTLGEHNRDVLKNMLCYTDEQIKQLSWMDKK